MTDRALRAALLISVKPRWAIELIDGTKTVEFRRRGPGADAIGKPLLLYASGPLSQLIGHGRILDVVHGHPSELWARYAQHGGIDEAGFRAYFSDARRGDALIVRCVSLLQVLALAQLRAEYNFRPPMSWIWLPVRSPLLNLIPAAER